MKEKRTTLKPKEMAQPLPSKNSGDAEGVVGYTRRSVGDRMVNDAVIQTYGTALLRITHISGNMYHVIRFMPVLGGTEYMESMFNANGVTELLREDGFSATGNVILDLGKAIMEIGFMELCYGQPVVYMM